MRAMLSAWLPKASRPIDQRVEHGERQSAGIAKLKPRSPVKASAVRLMVTGTPATLACVSAKNDSPCTSGASVAGSRARLRALQREVALPRDVEDLDVGRPVRPRR